MASGGSPSSRRKSSADDDCEFEVGEPFNIPDDECEATQLTPQGDLHPQSGNWSIRVADSEERRSRSRERERQPRTTYGDVFRPLRSINRSRGSGRQTDRQSAGAEYRRPDANFSDPFEHIPDPEDEPSAREESPSPVRRQIRRRASLSQMITRQRGEGTEEASGLGAAKLPSNVEYLSQQLPRLRVRKEDKGQTTREKLEGHAQQMFCQDWTPRAHGTMHVIPISDLDTFSSSSSSEEEDDEEEKKQSEEKEQEEESVDNDPNMELWKRRLARNDALPRHWHNFWRRKSESDSDATGFRSHTRKIYIPQYYGEYDTIDEVDHSQQRERNVDDSESDGESSESTDDENPSGFLSLVRKYR